MLNINLNAKASDAGFEETYEEFPATYTPIPSVYRRYEEMRNTLRAEYHGDYRPFIRVVPDMFNNVGRLCTFRNSGGRVWQIKQAMQDQNGIRYYHMTNLHTGEMVIAWADAVSNLY